MCPARIPDPGSLDPGLQPSPPLGCHGHTPCYMFHFLQIFFLNFLQQGDHKCASGGGQRSMVKDHKMTIFLGPFRKIYLLKLFIKYFLKLKYFLRPFFKTRSHDGSEHTYRIQSQCPKKGFKKDLLAFFTTFFLHVWFYQIH